MGFITLVALWGRVKRKILPANIIFFLISVIPEVVKFEFQNEFNVIFTAYSLEFSVTFIFGRLLYAPSYFFSFLSISWEFVVTCNYTKNFQHQKYSSKSIQPLRVYEATGNNIIQSTYPNNNNKQKTVRNTHTCITLQINNINHYRMELKVKQKTEKFIEQRREILFTSFTHPNKEKCLYLETYGKLIF